MKPFPAEQDPTFQSLRDDSGTVENIRLWDWRPLLDTYAQLQEIRTYYRFLDVDVDRYHLDGSYQQVMLSPRELDPSLLSANAQTWVNLHLLFTHGNGVVMSPVTRKSAEGLPTFYLKDIPPVATGGPPITEPRIYFGQSAAGYVIVKAATPEFDYPKGKDNAYTRYDGADGVPIGGIAWRSLFAWYFGDVNILLSGYIASESKSMLHRNIKDRVETIAPFLQLDRDPYMAISEGRLYWIQDAYTTSAWFPYAKSEPGGGDINYIRNSVKIVIDAYNSAATIRMSACEGRTAGIDPSPTLPICLYGRTPLESCRGGKATEATGPTVQEANSEHVRSALCREQLKVAKRRELIIRRSRLEGPVGNVVMRPAQRPLPAISLLRHSRLAQAFRSPLKKPVAGRGPPVAVETELIS